jgi:DNA polymerase/3'-5' exonuclease PolX
MSNNTQSKLSSQKFPYAEAHAIALDVLKQLQPFCVRAEIAGSIRRKKKEVGDIEIVAIPKPYSSGQYESGIATIVNRWPKVKGELEFGKTRYTQRILPSGIKLDLFFATEANWGSIFAIRTGSAEFSHKVLAIGWVKHGFKSEGGILFRNGQRYEVHEEEDLFKLAGVSFVEPEKRNY